MEGNLRTAALLSVDAAIAFHQLKELYYVTDKLDDLLRYVETPVNKIRTVKELKDG